MGRGVFGLHLPVHSVQCLSPPQLKIRFSSIVKCTNVIQFVRNLWQVRGFIWVQWFSLKNKINRLSQCGAGLSNHTELKNQHLLILCQLCNIKELQEKTIIDLDNVSESQGEGTYSHLDLADFFSLKTFSRPFLASKKDEITLNI